MYTFSKETSALIHENKFCLFATFPTKGCFENKGCLHSQVLWIFYLLLLTTSALSCLQQSRNQGMPIKQSSVVCNMAFDVSILFLAIKILITFPCRTTPKCCQLGVLFISADSQNHSFRNIRKYVILSNSWSWNIHLYLWQSLHFFKGNIWPEFGLLWQRTWGQFPPWRWI